MLDTEAGTSDSSPATRSKLHPVFKRLGALLVQMWLLLGAVLLVFLVADQVLKAAFKAPKPALVAGSVKAIARSNMSLVQAHAQYWKEHDQAKDMRWRSYVYFRRAPFVGQAIEIDAHGFRKTAQNSVDSSTIPVWIFGASTVWGTGVDTPNTLPSLLNASGAGRIDALNFGESGYVSMQSSVSFQRALACGGYAQVAVFVDGVNDVYSALQHGKAGLPQNEQNRVVEFTGSQSAKDIAIGLFNRLQGVQRLKQRLQPVQAPDDTALVKGVVDAYLATIANTRAVALAANIRPVFIWQPSVFSKHMLSTEERAIVANSELRHQQLQLKSTQLLKSRVRQQGLSDVFVLDTLFDSYPESLYFDFSHTTNTGNQILAEWIFRQIEPGLDRTQNFQPSETRIANCIDLPIGAL
jgi:hypothetical protein